jgi:predicted CXXCH cytochrome family protein
MNTEIPPTKKRISRSALLVGILGIAAAATMISCAGLGRTVIIPPHIEGATFVGNKSCAECHGNITKDFPGATHARLMAHGANATEMGCEGCHGAGSVHNESGGARHTIINPNKSPEVCFTCHMDMKARFATSHHHPVENGKVACSDCHNPHSGQAVKGGGTALMAQMDTCVQCHAAQRGPFVFEHEAIREGCPTCHDPHGTPNDKMLTSRSANLCLKCHFQTMSPTGQLMIGNQRHDNRINQGTCWSAGCHEAVHGSHVSSSLRF